MRSECRIGIESIQQKVISRTEPSILASEPKKLWPFILGSQLRRTHP